MRPGILIAALTGVLLLAAEHCQAQVWGFGTPYLYGAGYGLYVYERIPQYSLFPPVYYRYPRARPYGYSPYAYPPGYVTPEPSAISRRILVVNDYVPQQAASESPLQQSKPLVMKNPYVATAAHAINPAPQSSQTASSGG